MAKHHTYIYTRSVGGEESSALNGEYVVRAEGQVHVCGDGNLNAHKGVEHEIGLAVEQCAWLLLPVCLRALGDIECALCPAAYGGSEERKDFAALPVGICQDTAPTVADITARLQGVWCLWGLCGQVAGLRGRLHA